GGSRQKKMVFRVGISPIQALYDSRRFRLSIYRIQPNDSVLDETLRGASCCFRLIIFETRPNRLRCGRNIAWCFVNIYYEDPDRKNWFSGSGFPRYKRCTFLVVSDSVFLESNQTTPFWTKLCVVFRDAFESLFFKPDQTTPFWTKLCVVLRDAFDSLFLKPNETDSVLDNTLPGVSGIYITRIQREKIGFQGRDF